MIRTGVMDDPGSGASVWQAGQQVTTDPTSPNFLDVATFDAMVAAGKISEAEQIEVTSMGDEEKRFLCSVCGKEYKTESGKDRHESKHVAEAQSREYNDLVETLQGENDANGSE